MTRAQDRIKAAMAELAEAKADRNGERVDSFRWFVTKKLGRPIKRGDTIVVDQWLCCPPFRVHKLGFDEHPCIEANWVKLSSLGGALEYLGPKDLAWDMRHSFHRGQLKSLRFARPDELSGEAYYFKIGQQPQMYDTFEDAIGAIKRRCKIVPSLIMEQRGRIMAMWREGKKHDEWLRYSAPHWWVSVWRREDHPF